MHNYALKFIMVGDSRVGKSQLTRCFTKKQFNHDSQSTVGMEFSTRSIEFEKSLIKAQLWDTAGQERFESMTKAYFRDAVGSALVFDIGNRQSFLNLRSIWLRQLRSYGHEGMRLILVGNKVDLVHSGQSQREVATSEAIEFAKELNIDYIETSALTGFAVENMFRRLVLSVAKLLPEVRVHLELTALPEGWMIEFDTSMQPVARQVSDDGRTSTETSSFQSSLTNSMAGSSAPKSTLPDEATASPSSSSSSALAADNDQNKSGHSECLSQSLPETSMYSQKTTASKRSSASTGALRDSPPPRSISKYIYINYWTGDTQKEMPTGPAVTGLLYVTQVEAPRPPSIDLESAGPDGDATHPKNFGRQSSLDERALTERSSSARTLDLRRNSRSEKSKVRTCPRCVIS